MKIKREEVNVSKSEILSKLFIMWFILSLVGMCVLAALESLYCLAIFGQFILIFALGAMSPKNKKKKILVTSIAVIVEIGIILICFLFENPNLFVSNLNWTNISVVIALTLFILIGLCILAISLKKYKKAKAECTFSVYATIERYSTHYSDNRNLMYRPIYRYEYEGNIYEEGDPVSSNRKGKEIGTLVQLKINPQKPEEFFSGSEKFTYGLSIIIGSVFAFATLPLLIYFIQNNSFIIS